MTQKVSYGGRFTTGQGGWFVDLVGVAPKPAGAEEGTIPEGLVLGEGNGAGEPKVDVAK